MVTLTSASCIPHSVETSSFENDHLHLRNASFSSYLNRGEKSFVCKLADSSPNPIAKTQEDLLHLGGSKEEIGVFGAERYFKGGMDNDIHKIESMDACNQYKEDEKDVLPVKPKFKAVAPSLQSESSWNSQSILLQNIVKNPSQSRTKRVPGKSFLSGFCGCSCSDKDSVKVDDYIGEISFNRNASCGTGFVNNNDGTIELVDREPQPEQKLDHLGAESDRELCFTFPIQNPAVRNLVVKTKIQDGDDDMGRKSIEVFGSPALGKRSKPLSTERRLTLLSLDATPRMGEIEFSTTSGGIYMDDNESDASSDLFEIESLTGRDTPFIARKASEATSGCMTPTTCYAPSEASIDWSVVTASAADYDERRPSFTITSPIKALITTTNEKIRSKEMQRRRSSILLGCNSHKAVRVAGDAYIRTEKVHSISNTGMHLRSDSLMPVTKLQAETKLTGFSSRARSISPRASHHFFIQ